MCHIAGVTPEAATLDQALGGKSPKRQVTFGEDELADAYRQLRNNTSDVVDTVILGCPHASLQEIAEIALYLKGKHIADGVKLWVCTAYATRANAERLGYAKMISDAGGYVFCDTCPTNMRIPAQRIVTPGFKQAHYARGMTSLERLGTAEDAGCASGLGGAVETIVADTPACIRAALEGRWLSHG